MNTPSTNQRNALNRKKKPLTKVQTDTIKAIIKAYRKKAFVMVTYRRTQDSLYAKTTVRSFGPVNQAYHHGNQTLYAYVSNQERLKINCFVNKLIGRPQTDLAVKKSKIVTPERQKEIEKRLIQAYRDGAQFTVGLPISRSREEAKMTLRPFGPSTLSKTDDGRDCYIVDDIDRQIEAIASIGYVSDINK